MRRARSLRPQYLVAVGLLVLIGGFVWVERSSWSGSPPVSAPFHRPSANRGGNAAPLNGVAGGSGGSRVCFPASRETPVTPLRGYPAAAARQRLLRGQLPVSIRATALPSVLYARPHGPEVVDLTTAGKVAGAMWTARERAGAQDNGPMLSALETGAARAWDVARANEVIDAGTRSQYVVRPMQADQVEVPYQTSYPACFLAIVGTTPFPDNGNSPGTPVIDVLVFSRNKAAAPWRVALHTSFTQTAFENENILRAETPDEAHPGYAARGPDPGWFPPSTVFSALASYWQTWKTTGQPPPDTPFLPGTYTSGEGQFFASPSQDQVDPASGARIHETFDANQSLDGRFDFAIRDGWTVSCSAVRGHVLLTPGMPGSTLQQTRAHEWGYALPLGNYSSITNTIIRQTCAVVQPTRAQGAALLGLDGYRLNQTGIQAPHS